MPPRRDQPHLPETRAPARLDPQLRLVVQVRTHPTAPTRPAILLALAVVLWGAASAPHAAPTASDKPLPTNLHRAVLPGEPALASAQRDAAARALLAAGRADESLRVPAVAARLAAIDAQQDTALAAIRTTLGRDVRAHHRYRLVANGFTIALRAEEVKRLREAGWRLQRDLADPLLTIDSVPAVGASALWTAPPLTASRAEGQVVGVIDTGINFAHPAFAARTEDGYEHVNPRPGGGFGGWCDPANPRYDPAYACNRKLIAAWDFADGIRVTGSVNGTPVDTTENDGPVDDNGHGSAVASVAVGNTVDSLAITGVAPRANLVAYDACISIPNVPGAGFCPRSAQLAAVEQAILDGVDVLNLSISGGRDPWGEFDVDRALLEAVAAGIFVAAGAGNSGAVGSVSHLGPWVTSTGASVKVQEQAQLGQLGDFVGGTPPSPIPVSGLDGSGIYPAGTPLTEFVLPERVTCTDQNFCGVFPAQSCLTRLDPDALVGRILVCEQRPNDAPRAYLSIIWGNVVAQGRGDEQPAGIVLIAAAAGTPLPLVSPVGLEPRSNYPLFTMISREDGMRLRQWLESTPGSYRGRIGPLLPPSPIRPTLATFSSRGPNPGFDVAKPDLLAPGQSIATAFRGARPGETPPPSITTQYTGTSFASPHVAGAAALLRARRPALSVAELQSALVASANPDINAFATLPDRAGIDAAGAGLLAVDRAARLPLVLDETVARFRAADPRLGGDPGALNLAALAESRCTRSCTWTRTVRNVDGVARTWTAQVDAPAGLAVVATPATFTLQPGAAQSVQVQVTVTPGVAIPAAASASLRWTSNGVPDTRLPILVGSANGARLEGLLRVTGNAPTGSTRIVDLGSGPTGGSDIVARIGGASAASQAAPALRQDPTNGAPYDDPTQVAVLWIDPPAGGTRSILATLGATTAEDIDLYVGIDDDGDARPSQAEQRCASAGSTSEETCRVDDPPAGRIWVVVQSFTASAADAADVVPVLFGAVPRSSSGNLTASVPVDQPVNTPFDLAVEWNLPGLAVVPHLATIDLGTAAAPTALGTALIVLTADVDGRLFANGFE
jgi:subtilisin family serine protease